MILMAKPYPEGLTRVVTMSSREGVASAPFRVSRPNTNRVTPPTPLTE